MLCLGQHDIGALGVTGQVELKGRFGLRLAIGLVVVGLDWRDGQTEEKRSEKWCCQASTDCHYRSPELEEDGCANEPSRESSHVDLQGQAGQDHRVVQSLKESCMFCNAIFGVCIDVDNLAVRRARSSLGVGEWSKSFADCVFKTGAPMGWLNILE